MATKAKKTQHPKHIVDLSLFTQDIAKAGSALDLAIFHQVDYFQKKRLGTMQIGQGGIGWAKKGGKKIHRIGWSAFAALMNEHFGLDD
jgi:hypothetical protein